MRLFNHLAPTLLSFLFCTSVYSQPGSSDPTFNIEDTEPYNEFVQANTSAVQSDGKIVIGGIFNTYLGVSRKNIARINPDGYLDYSFNPGSGADGFVYSVNLQTDEKIIITGDFTTYNGSPKNRIVRINTDGSVDNTFNTGSGANGLVTKALIQSDGKIIIVGNFTSYNGTAITRIARLNTNGSLDNTFNPGSGADYTIETLAIESNGKIVIGGNFTSYNGTSRNRIARINSNGSIDGTFAPSSGANDIVSSLFIQSDGKIIVGGWFTTFNSVTKNRITRLNSDGSLDATFNPGTGVGNYSVLSITQKLDGNLIIAGSFTSFNGASANRIAVINTNGALINTFSPNASGQICSVIQLSNGDIFVGGGFNTISGQIRQGRAMLGSDGNVLSSFYFGTGADNDVFDIATQPDGKLIIAGDFMLFNQVNRKRIARLNSDGSLDTTFVPDGGADDIIWSTSLQADNKVIIGGEFSSVNYYSRNRIARLNADGTIDTTFNPGNGGNNRVWSTCVLSDGKILIGGTFTMFDTVSKLRIARLNPDGSLDNTFGATVSNGEVRSIVELSNGKILIGGTFTTVNGLTMNRIAQLNPNGTLDASFSLGTGADGEVRAITVRSDGKILVAGNFTTFNSTNNNRIVLLNDDGTVDGSFSAGSGANGLICSTTILSNDKIIIAGDYHTYDGQTSNNISLLNSNGSLDNSFSSGTGSDFYISATAIQQFGKIIIGGAFNLYNGTPRNGVLRTILCEPTYANISLSQCESYTWINNVTYTVSGIYTCTIENNAGCDSIITLDLTILNQSTDIEDVFSLPSDPNTCVGAFTVDYTGTPDFELIVDGSSSGLTSNEFALFTDLCPGIHDLQIVNFCGDTLTAQFVVPVDSNYVFNNPFLDSLAQDSLGVTLEDCIIYYNGIDTAYIDSIWANGNTVNVIWNIVDSNGSNFDTTTYVLNNGNGVYYLQLSIFCPNKALGDYFTVTEAIYFEDGTVSSAGINDLEETSAWLFPNPTNDLVTITFDGNEAELVVYGTQGKLIQTSTITSGEQVSLNDVETGIYFFEITTEKGRITQRIVKN